MFAVDHVIERRDKIIVGGMEESGSRIGKRVGQGDGIVVFGIEDLVGGKRDEGGVRVTRSGKDVGMASKRLEYELANVGHWGFVSVDGRDEADVAFLYEVVERDGGCVQGCE